MPLLIWDQLIHLNTHILYSYQLSIYRYDITWFWFPHASEGFAGSQPWLTLVPFVQAWSQKGWIVASWSPQWWSTISKYERRCSRSKQLTSTKISDILRWPSDQMTSSCSTLPASSRSPASGWNQHHTYFWIHEFNLWWIQSQFPRKTTGGFQLGPNSQLEKNNNYEPYDELLRVNHVYNWHKVTTWKVRKIIKSTFAWNICTFQICWSFWFLPFDDFPVLSLLPSECCPTPREPPRLCHWTVFIVEIRSFKRH